MNPHFRKIKTLVDALRKAAGNHQEIASCRKRIHESVLGIEVRGPWTEVEIWNENVDADPAEYRLTFAGIGPLVQVQGDLDEDIQPDHALLVVRDFGAIVEDRVITDDQNKTLLLFAQQFKFTTK